MDISFIILAWNSGQSLDACLAALFAELDTAGFSYEIIVADNGSTDSTPAILGRAATAHPGRLEVIRFDRNRGTTYARNRALERARGAYIGVMDSDVEIGKGCVAELKRVIDSDASIGLVAPMLLYPDGRFQKSTDEFPTAGSKLRRYFFLKRMEKDEEGQRAAGSAVVPVDYAISALWLLKREAVEKVGPFDERIFYSPEDVDYCLRLWKAGYKVVYDRSISAIHHTQEISRGFRLNRAFWWHVKGLGYYFLKHKSWLHKPSV